MPILLHTMRQAAWDYHFNMATTFYRDFTQHWNIEKGENVFCSKHIDCFFSPSHTAPKPWNPPTCISFPSLLYISQYMTFHLECDCYSRVGVNRNVPRSYLYGINGSYTFRYISAIESNQQHNPSRAHTFCLQIPD